MAYAMAIARDWRGTSCKGAAKPTPKGCMEIRRYTRPAELPNLSGDILAFDLEMANSFRDASPVICMIGTEYYESGHSRVVITIASITLREEEPELIAWFLAHLSSFEKTHSQPKMATFSGSDNDIPWVQERITRYEISPEQAGVMDRFENLDLRVEFHKSTQNDKISLKKLEELFGIERASTLSSRKVSFMLTDVLTPGERVKEIPERIFEYLEDDIHHLLVILNRWNDEALSGHYLTEYEYLNRVAGLIKHCQKLSLAPSSRFPSSFKPGLADYGKILKQALYHAVSKETFAHFDLPPLPELPDRHPESDRMKRRFRLLSSIQIWDRNRKKYRLGQQLQKPKGTLAVVRNNGKVLMIRRAAHIDRAPGFWGLPGGVLEKGENPEAGAERELREEVNLEGNALVLLGTQPSMNQAYELFWVEVQVEDFSTLAPNPDEAAEARWVSPEELSRLEPLIPGAGDGFRAFLGSEWNISGDSRGGRKRRKSRGGRGTRASAEHGGA